MERLVEKVAGAVSPATESEPSHPVLAAMLARALELFNGVKGTEPITALSETEAVKVEKAASADDTFEYAELRGEGPRVPLHPLGR